MSGRSKLFLTCSTINAVLLLANFVLLWIKR
jgi:hypothetical protein